MLFGIATLNLFLIGCIAWWISRKVSADLKLIFWAGLVVRLTAGIALGLVYYYYYGLGDTIVYFQEAVKLNELAIENPSAYTNSLLGRIPLGDQEPRAFFFTALLSIINFITGWNYWLSSLWFSLFSFVCTWYLVRQIVKLLPDVRQAAIVALLFFPTVVFWSSGIIKESVAFGALCFLAAIFCKLIDGRRPGWIEYVAVLVSIWLLLSLKYYWAAVFFPAASTSLLVHWFIEKRVQRTGPLVACWLGIFVVLCWGASFTHPNFYLEEFLLVIRQNHDEFVAISSPGNLIHFPRLVDQWSDVALNAPWALFSGLFRPLPHEAYSPTGIVGSLENLALLVLVLLKLWRLRKATGTARLMVLSVLAYSILLCIFLAMSTPNFGTLSRYRIGFLPFFALLILHGNPAMTWIGVRLKANRAGHISNI